MIEQSNTAGEGRNEHAAFMAWIDEACTTSPRALVAMPARMAWLAALEWAGGKRNIRISDPEAGRSQIDEWLATHSQLVHGLTVDALNDGACGLAIGDHPATDSAADFLEEHARLHPGAGWTRSAAQPPPVGMRVALFTPGHDLEEFVNEGPAVYPDWSCALSWWVALPASSTKAAR